MKRRMVVKAPTGFQIFPEPRLAEQFRLLQILARTEISVPGVHWQETSSDVLSARSTRQAG